MQNYQEVTFKCTFCIVKQDYIDLKIMKRLLDEMKELNLKKQINNFWFTDSLINGSMKNFKLLVEKLETEMDNGNYQKCIGVDILEHIKNLMENY